MTKIGFVVSVGNGLYLTDGTAMGHLSKQICANPAEFASIFASEEEAKEIAQIWSENAEVEPEILGVYFGI